MNLASEREREQRNRQGYDFNVQWSQMTAQYVPWGHTASSPASSLVTFSASEAAAAATRDVQRPPVGSFCRQTLLPHCKRKADLDVQLSPSAKQHITEERMAAHMSRLHISSETAPEAAACPEEAARSREQRLYVCEEMRRLQTESILPSSLLGRLERPCMAVMLWQPPPKIPELLSPPPPLGRSVRHALQRTQPAPDENDNNNSCVLDLNNMDMDT